MALSSTTLVNVSEDAELRLVSLLGEAAPPNLLGSNFRDTCATSISNGDASSLLETIIQDKGAVAALTILPHEQATAAVSIIAALLQRLASPNITQALTNAVTNAQAPEDRKIHLLSVLYNMRSDVEEKCALLATMIQLACTDADVLLAEDSTLGRLVRPPPALAFATSQPQPLPRIVTLLDSWKVSAEGRRDLYRTIAQVVPSQKQRFLLLLCETYNSNNSSSSSSPEALDVAKQASIGAIRDPITHFFEQRSLVQWAKGLQTSDPFLYDLLKIFARGKIADYQTLTAGKESQLQELGLDPVQCSKHMRILSLCSLAAEHEEIPYAVVAETLQVEQKDVEGWVIAAVHSGLLQTKMDQLAESVIVERCVVRYFDDTEQWKALQSRLKLWKENVGNILQTIEESQESM